MARLEQGITQPIQPSEIRDAKEFSVKPVEPITFQCKSNKCQCSQCKSCSCRISSGEVKGK